MTLSQDDSSEDRAVIINGLQKLVTVNEITANIFTTLSVEISFVFLHGFMLIRHLALYRLYQKLRHLGLQISIWYANYLLKKFNFTMFSMCLSNFSLVYLIKAVLCRT